MKPSGLNALRTRCRGAWNAYVRLMDRQGFYVVLALCVLTLVGSAMLAQARDDAGFGADAGISRANTLPSNTSSAANSADPAAVSASGEDAAVERLAEAQSAQSAQIPQSAQSAQSPQSAQSQPSPRPALIAEITPRPASPSSSSPPSSPSPALPALARPVGGRVTRAFSDSAAVWFEAARAFRTHPAVDLAADAGEVVRAALDGTVLSIAEGGADGLTVTLSHADGLQTVYAGLASAPYARAGDRIRRGQTIAHAGAGPLDENADGAHLHFALLRDGVPVDPTRHFSDD